MKNQNILMIAVMALVFSGVSYADSTAPAQSSKGVHPCQQIEQACSAAGFVKGEAKEGKGLFKNCMKPIMSGQQVQGVSIDPSLVPACQAKRAAHQQKKQSS